VAPEANKIKQGRRGEGIYSGLKPSQTEQELILEIYSEVSVSSHSELNEALQLWEVTIM
jgi:hypothetical protein